MKQEFNSESGDRDRKRPSSDGRESGFGKRRRPDEAEDGWAGKTTSEIIMLLFV